MTVLYTLLKASVKETAWTLCVSPDFNAADVAALVPNSQVVTNPELAENTLKTQHPVIYQGPTSESLLLYLASNPNAIPQGTVILLESLPAKVLTESFFSRNEPFVTLVR